MDAVKQHIAVICNYRLMPNRIGGMDYFFWAFNKACLHQDIAIDWFFPNVETHGEYGSFTIFPSLDASIEGHFLEFLKTNKKTYSHIVTHFVELCTPFYAKVKKLSEAKIISVDHNSRPIGGYPLKKKLKKRLKGALYARFIDVLVGVSNYSKREMIKDFGSHIKDKTIVVYNGVRVDKILERTEARAQSQPTFIVVSHLVYEKGIQDLIEAVDLLSDSVKEHVKIDIYGSGIFMEELVAETKKRHLDETIDFKGNNPNIHQTLRDYDYMLQPTHMECFSLSILESLAANVPVVTTNVGGNIEVIEDGSNGFIFEAKDIISLKGILEQLIEGKIGIVANTRSLIEQNFSMSKMVADHINLLQ